MSQINKIAVIGAGNMGSGIAQKIAQEGLNVVMVDLKDEYVDRGLGIINRMLQEGVERKIFKPEQVDDILYASRGLQTLMPPQMRTWLSKPFLKTSR